MIMELLPVLSEPGARRNGIKEGIVGLAVCVYAVVPCKPAEGNTELCKRINEYFSPT